MGIVVIVRQQSQTASVLKRAEDRGAAFVRTRTVSKLLNRFFGLTSKTEALSFLLDVMIPSPTPDELRSLHGSIQLRSLILTDGRVDEPLAELLGTLPFLSSLSLNDYELSDTDLRKVLKSFKKLGGLRMLQLRNTFLTDQGLAELGECTSLHSIAIDGSKIEGSGLAALNLSGYFRLSLQRANLSDTSLSAFASANPSPRLRELRLDGNPITDAGLKSLYGLTALDHLGIGGTKITPNGLTELLKKQALTGLGLNDLPWTMADLQQLPHDSNKLVQLDLAGWSIGDEDLKSLPTLPKLGSLDLSRTRITDAGMRELARFPALKWIQLDGTQVTIKGLNELLKSLKLRTISVGKTGITYEDLLAMPPILSLESIVLDGADLSVDQLRKLGLRHPNACIRSDDRFVLPQNQ